MEQAAEAAERHGQLFFGGVAVDSVQPSDQYYRLAVDSCFFVAGMGASCRAESIGAAEYMVRLPAHAAAATGVAASTAPAYM